ncbi:hypothetical protein [Haloferula sp.]|uniref:hypothetical protein n=1 Tax=Haloferula sp. TaxID=2497595 RepID=UPI003C725461
MNRRRNEDHTSHYFAFFALVLAFVAATTGGAMHAIFRNGQIKTERKIAETRQRIEQHRLDMQMIEVRREKLVDRYEIREQLKHWSSELVPVTHGVVEKVRPLPESVSGPVASRS